MRSWLFLSLALAGCSTAYTGPCDSLCNQLVDTCNYAAYPTYSDCYDGCIYAQQQGSDVAGERQCVQNANCDTFQIVECEHAYGAQ